MASTTMPLRALPCKKRNSNNNKSPSSTVEEGDSGTGSATSSSNSTSTAGSAAGGSPPKARLEDQNDAVGGPPVTKPLKAKGTSATSESAAASTTTAHGATGEDGSQQEPMHAAVKEAVAAHSGKTSLADNRLPSKKRKSSHDSSSSVVASPAPPPDCAGATASTNGGDELEVETETLEPTGPGRKGSTNDSSVTFDHTSAASSSSLEQCSIHLEPLPIRKFSGGDTSSSSVPALLGTPRGVGIDDLLLSDPPPPAAIVVPEATVDPDSSSSLAMLLALSPTSIKAAASPPIGSKGSADHTCALEHLDALTNNNNDNKVLGSDKKANNPQQEKADDTNQQEQEQQTTKKAIEEGGDDGSSQETFASSGHRLLLEAIMMADGRERSESRDAAALGSGSSNSFGNRERLESWGGLRSYDEGRDRLESWGGNSRLNGGARDRLESWGGMSDLSLLQGSSDPIITTASYPGHTAQQSSAAAAAAVSSAAAAAVAATAALELEEPGSIPSRILLTRDRLNSIASLSEASVSNFPFVIDGIDLSGDIQAFVAVAMATVGDELSELAGAVESAAAAADSILSSDSARNKGGPESETSSVASPIIGAATDSYGQFRGRGGGNRPHVSQRPRSLSNASGTLSVNLDAVQAAVDAAGAVTDELDLSSMGPSHSNSAAAALHEQQQQQHKKRVRRNLPTKRNRSGTSNATPAKSSPKKKRVAASGGSKKRPRSSTGTGVSEQPLVTADCVPSDAVSGGSPHQSHKPIKKRAKRSSPTEEAKTPSGQSITTPKLSNKSSKAPPDMDEAFLPPAVVSSTPLSSKAAKGQSNQKWESMFDCLLMFIGERQEEETKQLTAEQKSEWVWDGNVPTNYKTNDGKALGRWVNNQRSAKSKGTLKEDREQRLVDAGLKWSVLASNSWNLMLEEVRLYGEEKSKKGKPWDGNVPTTYQIKTKDRNRFAGEDKNLGRWVNRQRSLFQAGKLREDRQLALEKVGLKWSVLATTPWDTMYDTLLEYVKRQKRDQNGTWDGNVPANYRTTDTPPRALGRWINRQRSAYNKSKLKKEYVDKLNDIGLKWAVHIRQGDRDGDSDDHDDDYDNDDDESGASQPQDISKVDKTSALVSSASCNGDPVGSHVDQVTQKVGADSLDGSDSFKSATKSQVQNVDAAGVGVDDGRVLSAAPVTHQTSAEKVEEPIAQELLAREVGVDDAVDRKNSADLVAREHVGVDSGFDGNPTESQDPVSQEQTAREGGVDNSEGSKLNGTECVAQEGLVVGALSDQATSKGYISHERIAEERISGQASPLDNSKGSEHVRSYGIDGDHTTTYNSIPAEPMAEEVAMERAAV